MSSPAASIHSGEPTVSVAQANCHEPIISPRASKTSMHHVTLP
jgi:hypothetical protein